MTQQPGAVWLRAALLLGLGVVLYSLTRLGRTRRDPDPVAADGSARP